MENPQISVIIPVYNRGIDVEKTVRSVLEQDIQIEQIEVIIVDDGSTDNTWLILNELYGKNEIVRLHQIPNGGVARARNFGLQQAVGEFIAFLDHDDLWLPRKLTCQIKKMVEKPEVGVVYCDWMAIDGEGNQVGKPSHFCLENGWTPAEGKVTSWLFSPHNEFVIFNPIISMSVPLIRAELLKKVGGFDEVTVPSDDWDIWIRLARETEFAYCEEVYVQYRFHEGQQHTNSLASFNSFNQILSKYEVCRNEDLELWERQIKFRQFVRKFQNHFLAKEALFNRKYMQLLKYLTRQFFISPAFVFSKQHIYLLSRILRLKSERY